MVVVVVVVAVVVVVVPGSWADARCEEKEGMKGKREYCASQPRDHAQPPSLFSHGQIQPR